jgi:hypothetical protein
MAIEYKVMKSEEDDEIEIIELNRVDEEIPTKKILMENSKDEFSWFQTAIIVFQRGLPLTLTFTLGNVANFIVLYFAGHIKSDEEDRTDIFAGVSMSILFSNISCLSILVGMTGAVETLGLRLSTLASLFNSLIT